MSNFFDELNIAITVCNTDGKVLWMNDKSKSVNKGDFVGQSLLDCHPEPAKTKLLELLDNHNTNAYTIEKGDVKKLIYQTPWFENGEFAGYVELSIEIPFEMPHFVRKPKI
ncbi:MAG: diguanylate cyclase [Bacteroidales bacterium]|jgi:transcriptional regulator with PAS, ATPase and Fis domain|nr:diguanylate cyclase [Bacteroidales bacterium]